MLQALVHTPACDAAQNPLIGKNQDPSLTSTLLARGRLESTWRALRLPGRRASSTDVFFFELVEQAEHIFGERGTIPEVVAQLLSDRPHPCLVLVSRHRIGTHAMGLRSGPGEAVLTTSDAVRLIAAGILTLSARSRIKPSRVRRGWRVSRVSPSWLCSFPAFPPIRRPSQTVRGERSTTQRQAHSSHHAGNDRR